VCFCVMICISAAGHVQGRISFQLNEAGVGEFSRRLIGSSYTLSVLKRLEVA